ncbi:stretch-activated Ca2+-permeable channel component-domain-containing protein [Suillus spraguei]|nr:stretch-activated Ca2+-permeable channel component-domain-containing protein [Suillus spraguei]
MRRLRLPRSLWCFIYAIFAVSAQESLNLDTLYSFSGASLSSDPTFSLPQAQQLTVSVAICSTGTTSPVFLQGGSLVVQNVGQTSFQVAASTGVALVHELIPALPPSPPLSPPAFSLVIAPTSSGLASGMQTACSINSTSSSGLVVKLSGPVYFTTKSPSFPCPLVHSLPFCPSTSYTYMTNFTTMLLMFPCGRDLYSPLQTCESCQEAYRAWLCSSPSSSFSPSSPTPALTLPQSGSNARNPFLPNVSFSYQTVLPCLEVCSAADRACPNFLGIKCPTPRFNAASSYGVGFIDEGEQGVAQDRWGNVWCNPS